MHCGDRGVAEEIAQDALLRTWERWQVVRTVADPAAWTYRVAFNMTASWYRRRAAERRARQRMSPLVAAEPDHAQALAVRRAVVALPPRRRTALVLRYYLDLSVATTAEVMGCRQGTVKALCAQATAALRDHPSLMSTEGSRHV